MVAGGLCRPSPSETTVTFEIINFSQNSGHFLKSTQQVKKHLFFKNPLNFYKKSESLFPLFFTELSVTEAAFQLSLAMNTGLPLPSTPRGGLWDLTGRGRLL